MLAGLLRRARHGAAALAPPRPLSSIYAVLSFFVERLGRWARRVAAHWWRALSPHAHPNLGGYARYRPARPPRYLDALTGQLHFAALDGRLGQRSGL